MKEEEKYLPVSKKGLRRRREEKRKGKGKGKGKGSVSDRERKVKEEVCYLKKITVREETRRLGKRTCEVEVAKIMRGREEIREGERIRKG